MSNNTGHALKAFHKIVEQDEALTVVESNASQAVKAAREKLQEACDREKIVCAKVSRDKVKLEARRKALLPFLSGSSSAVGKELVDEVILESDLTSTLAISKAPSTVGASTSMLGHTKRLSTLLESATVATRSESLPTKKRKRVTGGASVATLAGGSDIPDEEYKVRLDTCKAFSKFDLAPTIIKGLDGVWYELRCGSCGGNFSDLTGGFLKGISAFQTHLKKSHEYDGSGWPQVFEVCKSRLIPDEEMIEMMKKGAAGVPYIERVDVQTDVQIARRTGVKKQNEQASDWNWVKDPKNMITNCQVIVRHPDGYWVELACPICHGNTSSKGGYLRNGAKGFFDHLKHAHGEDRMKSGPRVIIERCKVKDVCEEDVAKIKNNAPDAPLPFPRFVQSTTKTSSTVEEDGASGDEEDETIETGPTAPTAAKATDLTGATAKGKADENDK